MLDSQKNKLLIFDMDGTLFDTSESNYCAYRDAANRLGYHIDKENFMKQYVGRNYKEFLPLFGVDSEENMHYIHSIKKESYVNYLAKIKKNNELFQLIDDHKKDAVIALATTASRKNTIDILEYFEVRDRFDIILSQEDVKKLKPDPECYLKIMEMVDIAKEHTVIYEDSDVGIEAAIASGAEYVRVNDLNKNR